MMLTRTEWAMRFAATFLELRDGGVELSVLYGWGDELWVRFGHLDPGEVAQQEFAATAAPAVAAGGPAGRPAQDDG